MSVEKIKGEHKLAMSTLPTCNKKDITPQTLLSRRHAIQHIGIATAWIGLGCNETSNGDASNESSGIDTGTESGMNAGTESGMSAGTESDMNVGTESDMNTGTESDMNTGTESDMTAGTESDMTAGTESDMNAGTESDMTAGTEEQDFAVSCQETASQIEGPFYFNPNLDRVEIYEDRMGTPINFMLTIQDINCQALPNALVEIWHADAAGIYSGYVNQGQDTRGETFLRGAQVSDEQGVAHFTSVYPGWYPGRAAHVHFKVSIQGRVLLTSQFYFSDQITQAVYQQPPYQSRGMADTPRDSDRFFLSAGELADGLVMDVTSNDSGYQGQLVVVVTP